MLPFRVKHGAARDASGSQGSFTPRRMTAFAVCCLALFALAASMPETAFRGLNLHTAGMAALCLDAFGCPAQREGLTLTRGGFAVTVVTECSVLQMALLFFSFVASSPATVRDKLAGLALGVAFLHAANVLRIAAVFAAGLRGPVAFGICHVYLGQVVMILVVCAVCLVWLGSMQSAAGPDTPLRFSTRFLSISGILFLLWLRLNAAYIKVIDQGVRCLFTLVNYTLTIPYRHAIYYQSFNMVTVLGLVLAVRSRPGRKTAFLAIGFLVCSALQLADRCCDVLVTSFRSVAAGRAELLICFTGEYLVPVLLCLLVRNRLQQGPAPSGDA